MQRQGNRYSVNCRQLWIWSVGDSKLYSLMVILNVTAVGNGGSITSYTISNRHLRSYLARFLRTLSRLQMAMPLSHRRLTLLGE